MKKRIIFTVLMIILLTCVLSAHAFAATVASGYCGDTSVNGGTNVAWTLDDSGTLTVSGSGDMNNFSSAPWYSYRSQITDVNISSGVKSIGNYAFRDCSSLTSITIPDSVTSIGDYAFQNCSSLTSINIPDGVTSIGSDAFRNCSRLSNVYITDLEAWCKITFADYYSNPLYYSHDLYLNGQPVVNLVIPNGITSINNYAFYGCSQLIKVTIPDSVTSIGDRAFYYCSSLTSIKIPDSVTSIGNYAFYYCSSLTSVNIPDCVTSIGYGAFYGCSSLTSITIPDSVTSIEDLAFSGCSSLTSIIIPNTVTSIGSSAFYGCSSLTSVTIGNSVTSIGGWAFYGCSSLTSISIPDSVTSIGERAFYSCSNLTSINIPDSVTSIGNGAFFYCNLTSITIPNSVTSIENSAFDGCGSLKSVYITDLGAWCKIAFGNEYSNPLRYAHNLFLNGAKVEILEISDTVQVIPGRAFQGASCIKTVFIPKSVIGIAANAFAGCGGIEKVVYEGSESEWNDIAISSGNEYLVNAPRFYNSTLSEYYFTVSCEICAGGTLSVDKNAFAPGETVTVTASPYSGYELTAIYVDGEILDGNSFTATRNHVITAKFERLFGSDDCRIGDISVTGPDGNPCQTVPQGTFLATVPITNKTDVESVTVMLASYSSSGRFRGMAWLTFKNLPAGVTVDVTLPVDNTSGDVAELRAFVVDSLQSISPLGSAVSFGK